MGEARMRSAARRRAPTHRGPFDPARDSALRMGYTGCIMASQASHPEPVALERIVDALRTLGVAGNEEDRFFDASTLEAVRPALEVRLQASGHTGGGLAVAALPSAHDGVDVLVYDTTRYAQADDAERAWEADFRERGRDLVEARVVDWLRRLSALRAQIERWLRSNPDLADLCIVDLEPVILHEETMRRSGVAPARMPSFEVRDGERRVLRSLPKALWVVGANGRVDFVTRRASPIVVDRSRPLAPTSAWEMYFSDTRRAVPLTRETFGDLVRASRA